MKYAASVCFALALAIAACAGSQQGATVPSGGERSLGMHPHLRFPTPIQHVVIIFQENRTPDYLFHGMLQYGANIATKAVDSQGQIVQLKPISLAIPYDLGHSHKNFLGDCVLQPNGSCGMSGFDSYLPVKYHLRPYGYAPQSEVQPYLDMATQYVFADNAFQTNEAGSFPAHQYIISGDAYAEPVTTDNVSSDPYNSKTGAKTPAGCDAPKLSVVDTIDPVSGSPVRRRSHASSAKRSPICSTCAEYRGSTTKTVWDRGSGTVPTRSTTSATARIIASSSRRRKRSSTTWPTARYLGCRG